MKKSILILISFLLTESLFANFIVKEDSTIRERFVVSLLQDHDKDGRWIFVRVRDKCDGVIIPLIVSTRNLYNAYKDRYESDAEKLFIFNASVNIIQHNFFSNCEHSNNLIIGEVVDVSTVRKINRLTTEKILEIYFDNKKKLFTKYQKLKNELVAVLYLRNIKVITENSNNVYFEIFK